MPSPNARGTGTLKRLSPNRPARVDLPPAVPGPPEPWRRRPSQSSSAFAPLNAGQKKASQGSGPYEASWWSGRQDLNLIEKPRTETDERRQPSNFASAFQTRHPAKNRQKGAIRGRSVTGVPDEPRTTGSARRSVPYLPARRGPPYSESSASSGNKAMALFQRGFDCSTRRMPVFVTDAMNGVGCFFAKAISRSTFAWTRAAICAEVALPPFRKKAPTPAA